MKTLLLATALLAAAVSLRRGADSKPVTRVPIAELGKTHVLLGETQQPLGEMTTLTGLVLEGPSKGYDDGPNVRVQLINGQATQEVIQLQLVPYLGSLNVQRGCTYELRGYETGRYEGVPAAAQGEAGFITQASGFFFRVQYVVVSAKQIPAIEFSPEQFIDRKAVLQGTARNERGRAYLVGRDWRLLVDGAAWPPTMTGKEVAVLSTIRAVGDEPTFRAEQPQASPVNLADQIGQEVRLRGDARSRNDDWWLVYRGRWAYLGTRSELVARKFDLDAGPAIITGLVTETGIPQNVSSVPTEVMKRGKCFAIDVKTWQATDALLSPELGRPTE